MDACGQMRHTLVSLSVSEGHNIFFFKMLNSAEEI